MTEIFHLLFVFVLGGAGVFLFQKALARKIHAYQKRTARRIYRRINADTLGSAASVMAYLLDILPSLKERDSVIIGISLPWQVLRFLLPEPMSRLS